jgi:uncharacterized protein YgiM (DUF1202 family)
MKKIIVAATIACTTLSAIAPALAHSGRTDSNGCHTNRRTGEYHCHGGGGSSSPSYTPSYSTPSSGSSNTSQSRRTSTPDAACPTEENGYNARAIDFVNLRTGASTDSTIIVELSPGTKLKIHSWREADNDRRWAWLTTQDGKDGWAAGAFLSCL